MARRQSDDQPAVHTSDVTWRRDMPPCGSRANPSRALSISAALRTSGRDQLNSQSWGCGLHGVEILGCSQVRIMNAKRPVYARSNLLQQAQPLSAHRPFEMCEAGDIGPPPCNACDEARFHRIGNL